MGPRGAYTGGSELRQPATLPFIRGCHEGMVLSRALTSTFLKIRANYIGMLAARSGTHSLFSCLYLHEEPSI